MKFFFNYQKLKYWFKNEKRDLPWRQVSDPYFIWISEIMLQQTQVSVVIPYFLSWIEKYPTIRHLADASLDDLLKVWEGLGYYSRVRYLHQGAKYIVEHYDGQIPNQEEKLKKISGLGPYTIGAILSFAFHQKRAAVDGNVIRVLARYFALADDIAKSATMKKLRALAETLLPNDESWIVNEALIELGATICQRKAKCHVCPINDSCKGFKEGLVDQLPVNSKKTKIEQLYRPVAVIQYENDLLVKRGKKGSIMSDLYEFPYIECSEGGFFPQQLKRNFQNVFDLQLIQNELLKEVTQSFTRFRAQLFPVLFTCQNQKKIEEFEWLSKESLKKLAFSSGHRRIFQQII